MERKGIAIYGSTGSIGTQTLKIMEQLEGRFQLISIVCNNNIDLFEQQIRKYKPLYAGVVNEQKAQELQKRVADTSTIVVGGTDASIRICHDTKTHTVVNACVGFDGLKPTIECLANGKNVASANKESLVVAGKLIMDLAEKNNVKLLPIDSEHSAIWQCLQGESKNQIEKLMITASGGPFRQLPVELLRNVTSEQALHHPTWKMGPRITIDSSTLMNKGFEVIEANVLFGVNPKDIEVLIHPPSIVHSLVQFKDGSIKAQIGVPDMGIPIQYALTYPERVQNLELPRLDLTKKELKFEHPDMAKFPCLSIAFQALEKGGTAPAVLNAADERAVKHFLDGSIGYLDIPRLIDGAIRQHPYLSKPGLVELTGADKWAREYVDRNVSKAPVALRLGTKPLKTKLKT